MLERVGIFEHPEANETFQEVVEKIASEKFGAGAAYAREFSAMGHDVTLLYANALRSQLAWSDDTRALRAIPIGWRKWQLISRIPLFGPWLHNTSAKVKVLMSQIEEIQPDVVYLLDINFLNKRLLERIKKTARVVAGQIASPLPPRSYFLSYDHIFSAHPGQVQHFQSLGISSSWLPLAFDGDDIGDFEVDGWPSRSIDVSFVGSFGRHQRNTKSLMRAVGEKNPGLEIYTVTAKTRLEKWGLAKFYRGAAWGKQMRNVFARSKIVINRHGPVADGYSVNFRMFEATGLGALLVTEQGKNTSDLFEPGKEVLTYNSSAEAADLIQGALADFEKYKSIAAAGQNRTLKQHTYQRRAEETYRVISLLMSHAKTTKIDNSRISGTST